MTNYDSRLSSKISTHSMIRILNKQRKGLKVCHINAQSLRCKIDEFRYIFENSDTDVICISETWFNSSILDIHANLEGYDFFRADRDDKQRGGGVGIFIKKNFGAALFNYKGLQVTKTLISYFLKLHAEKINVY